MHKLDVVVISTNLALEQISQFEYLLNFFSIEWSILPWTVRQTKQQTWWTLKQQFNTLFKKVKFLKRWIHAINDNLIKAGSSKFCLVKQD